MKVLVRDRYGSPDDVVELRDVDPPVLTDDGVLVRVHASSVNPVEWHGVTGTPLIARLQLGLRKPKSNRLGVDFAGTVEAVGSEVTSFRPGDEVFGGRDGAFGEYVCVREEKAILVKPANLSFAQAATMPVAALTALQALRDKAHVVVGQRVLVNGASGGVGLFAVQLAKSMGATVTGVCSARNVELVRSAGADQVVDYGTEDYTTQPERYDVIIDVAGNHAWRRCRRVLAPAGVVVVVGGPKTNRWLGPLSHLLTMKLSGRRRVAGLFASINRADLLVLADLVRAGAVVPVIDREYDLTAGAEALGYVGSGHAQAKVVLTVRPALESKLSP